MNVVSNLLEDKKKRNGAIVAVVAVTLVLVSWLGFSSANAGSNIVAPTEAKVTVLEVAETIQASGSLEAQPFASLNWKTDGVIKAVNVKVGDYVKAGDILLTLEPSSTSSTIVSAQADLIDAQKDLDDLLNSGTDLAQAFIDLKDAQEDYDKKLYFVNYLNDPKNSPFKDTNLYMWETRRGGYGYRYAVREYKEPTESSRLEANNNLALAKSELYNAQQTYDRLKAGADSPDVVAAQARVDAAQATINQLSIVAPFDGQVLSLDDHVGDSVNTDDLSVNLADMNHLYVQTQVDESDIVNIKLGNQAKVTLDAVPGVTLTGEVTTINPVGEVDDSGLVKYTVRVDLDKLEEGTSVPLGTTANVVIQIKEASKTLMVPITALQKDSKGEYVLVIQSDNTALRVDVISGTTVGDQVAVTGDLKEGDRVQLAPKSQ